MRILAIGDFHGKFLEKLKNLAKKSDIILCTGDFGGSNKLLKIIFKYLDNEKPWWEIIGKRKTKKLVMEDYNSGINIIKELDKIGKPAYVVPGNWDFVNKKHFERFGKLNLEKYQDLIKKSKNIKWWNKGVKKINNLRILAFGGKLTPGAHIKENLLYKKILKF